MAKVIGYTLLPTMVLMQPISSYSTPPDLETKCLNTNITYLLLMCHLVQQLCADGHLVQDPPLKQNEKASHFFFAQNV